MSEKRKKRLREISRVKGIKNRSLCESTQQTYSIDTPLETDSNVFAHRIECLGW